MEDEPPMSLVQDHFDDESIDDRPVDGSFYDENELHEEEDDVLPTKENFAQASRYKPSHHQTPNQLPTICEEKHDDLRSGNSSRHSHRPSSTFPQNQSDFSEQFQNGVDVIEKYTENFQSKANLGDRMFPEGMMDKQFDSPQFKHNSWEPSLYHYEKQPGPNMPEESPHTGERPVFGDLSKKLENEKNEKVFIATAPTQSVHSVSPEPSSAPITSPYDSSIFLSAKTSTPKRPNTSRAHSRMPNFEMSSIYEGSPARTRQILPNPTETIAENQTISESMVRRVISNTDGDLLAALEQARKRREQQPWKMDFRVKAPVPTAPPPAAPSSSSEFVLPAPPEVARLQRSSTTGSRSSVIDNRNLTADMSRLSTAKSTVSSREDMTRASSVSKYRPSSTRSSFAGVRDGRESVNSLRSFSRASSTSSSLKPLRIAPRRIAFGPVPVNETLTMETEVENLSDRPCQIKCAIDSNTDVFQIVDNRMTMVEPGKSVKVRVAFTPTSIGRYQVMLNVENVAHNHKHSIPMWGVGGVASIQPLLSPELCPTQIRSEYTLITNTLSTFAFKLKNMEKREGFALLSVLDASTMRPIPSVTFFPSRGVVLRRSQEKAIRIQMPTSLRPHEYQDDRTSSAMSTVSISSTKRRAAASGAEFIVQISWGEEVMRQRLKMLETSQRRRELVDGLNFTSISFSDESTEEPSSRSVGVALPSSEDVRLFAATYRTTLIFVFSSQSRAAAFRSSSRHSDDTTIMESSAFRHATFVNDATMMPNSTMMRRH